jgi:hypothetical protein
MHNFKNKEYAITTSLNNNNSIFIKLVNNSSYATYEANFAKSAFQVSFDIAGVYRLLNKCFTAFVDGVEDSKYVVNIELGSMCIMMSFNCEIDECILVDFKLRLPETLFSGDTQMSSILERQGQLIEKFSNRLDSVEKINETYSRQIDELQKTVKEQNSQIEESKRIFDCIGDALLVGFQYSNTDPMYKKIGSTLLEIGCYEHSRLCENELIKIKYFYNLDKLVLTKVCVSQFVKTDCHNYDMNNSIVSNATLTKLRLVNCSQVWWENLVVIRNFPNLTELSISYVGGSFKIPESLETLKTVPHKLKKITFTHVTNAIGLQPYCEKNGIELIIQ